MSKKVTFFSIALPIFIVLLFNVLTMEPIIEGELPTKRFQVGSIEVTLKKFGGINSEIKFYDTNGKEVYTTMDNFEINKLAKTGIQYGDTVEVLDKDKVSKMIDVHYKVFGKNTPSTKYPSDKFNLLDFKLDKSTREPKDLVINSNTVFFGKYSYTINKDGILNMEGE